MLREAMAVLEDALRSDAHSQKSGHSTIILADSHSCITFMGVRLPLLPPSISTPSSTENTSESSESKLAREQSGIHHLIPALRNHPDAAATLAPSNKQASGSRRVSFAEDVEVHNRGDPVVSFWGFRLPEQSSSDGDSTPKSVGRKNDDIPWLSQSSRPVKKHGQGVSIVNDRPRADHGIPGCSAPKALSQPKGLGGGNCVAGSKNVLAQREPLEVAQEVYDTVPLDSTGRYTSLGSIAHDTGQCLPCAYWFKGICKFGTECSHCHFVHEGQRSKRLRPSKQTRIRLRRRAAARKGTDLNAANQTDADQIPDPESEHEDEGDTLPLGHALTKMSL